MSVTNRFVFQTSTNGMSPSGLNQQDAIYAVRKVADLFGRAAVGGCDSNLQVALAPVAAQATVTATGDGTANDTLTIGNVVITIVASGATGNQVNVGTSAANLASNINALVNSSASFTGIVTSSVNGAVITLTAALPGTIGNAIQLSKSSTALTLTHLFGASVAGSEGTTGTFSVGL